MKGIEMKLINGKQMILFLMTLMMLLFMQAQPSWSGVPQYVSDANTIVLDHFDGSTSATIEAYNNIGGCGSPYPSVTPSYSYVAGPNGLHQALMLNPPVGYPAGSGTDIKYPTGDLVSVANGTLEYWVYLPSYATGSAEQWPYKGACAGGTFGMGIDANGQLSASAWAAFNMNSGTASVPLKTWTHIAATWGSSGAKLYINGVQVGSDTNTGHPAAGYGGYLRIIGYAEGTIIDELRVSNIQRTTFNTPNVPQYVSDANTIVLDHFDGSTSATIEAYNNIGGCGSPYPSVTPSYSYVAGPNGLHQALMLNPPVGYPAGSGTDIKYPTGDLVSVANGTLEYWVYLPSYATGSAEQWPYKGACAGGTFGMGIDANGQLSASAWAAFNMNSGTASVPLKTWTHIAATWGSSGAKLYINGVQVGSDTNTGHPAAGYGGYLRIIGYAEGTIIDELRVSNIQRTTFNTPNVPQYVSDANTIVLDHFDGSTSATIEAYNNIGGCGSPYPSVTPSYSYVAGPNGLHQALMLNPPVGYPAGSGTDIKYPTGDLVSVANGTLEYWVYLPSYATGSAEQWPYKGACAGGTFGMGIDANGQLSASAWAAFNMNSGTASVPLKTWTHIAATWGSSGAKLYINGVQVGSDTNTGHPAAGYGGYLRIIGYAEGTIIDELRVSNIQRTTFNCPSTVATVKNDFNNDGSPDIVWRDTSTGRTTIWYMDGATWNGGYADILPELGGTEWELVGIADFNNDSNPDLLWRNTVNGRTTIWYMTGSTWNGGYADVEPTLSDMGWSIVGVADFNGDGSQDLLWRNSSTGRTTIWYMTGPTWNGGYADVEPTLTDPHWSIAGISDFNRDGSPDLLWRDSSTGRTTIWYMTGPIWNGGYADVEPTVSDPDWQIVAIRDFNGDGSPDLLWRNASTYRTTVWYMNGPTWNGNWGDLLPVVADPNWIIVGR